MKKLLFLLSIFCFNIQTFAQSFNPSDTTLRYFYQGTIFSFPNKTWAVNMLAGKVPNTGVSSINGQKTFDTPPIISSLSPSLPLSLDASGKMTSGPLNMFSTTAFTGTLNAARFPALTGDITTVGGSLATTYNGVVPVSKGGTNIGFYNIGDILSAGGNTTLTRISAVANGSVLVSNGVGQLPQYGKVNLTVHVSNTLPTANGGTGLNAIGTLNQLLRVNSAGTGLEYFTPSFGTGSVTSFGKTDNYGIISSVTNPTTTPVHAIAADTTNGTGLATKPYVSNYIPKSGIKTINSTSLLGAGNLNVGTVTSVDITPNSGIGASGGPITGSGSIALSLGNITPLTFSATSQTNFGSYYYSSRIAPSVTRTGTDSYIGMLISPLINSTGSGTYNDLFNVGVNSASGGNPATHTSYFAIDVNGNIRTSNTYTASQIIKGANLLLDQTSTGSNGGVFFRDLVTGNSIFFGPAPMTAGYSSTWILPNVTEGSHGATVASTDNVRYRAINQAAKTTNYTLTQNDYTIQFDCTSGALLANLPTAASCYLSTSGVGLIFNIKKIDTGVNTVTITPNGSDTIDGAATLVIPMKGNVQLQSTGTGWIVL